MVKYMVCVDSSEGSTKALKHIGHNVHGGDTLLLLAAYSSPSPALWGFDESLETNVEMEKEAEKQKEVIDKLLEKSKVTVLKEFQEKGIACTLEFKALLCEDIREGITKAVTDNKVDVTVLGSRGLGTVKSLLLGSVSTYLVQNSPSSVLVIR
eukprot:TRINITY_DN3379_c2_g1_i1.p1 TRINITY_DN3379_c2_g1~~TRINITY_DN3379_c2_g1_i1.p1  ORF type:complete len:153 (+),score=40.34 TRINITY_DN3379_c2_g1_i1:41-499(+)